MDVAQCPLSAHIEAVQPSESRPFCCPPQCSSVTVRELAARPRGRGSGCILCPPQSVGRRVRFSTYLPCRPVPSLHSPPQDSACCSSGSSLAHTGLLPATAEDVPPVPSSAAVVRGPRPMGASPPSSRSLETNRLDHIRRSAALRGLSQGKQYRTLNVYCSAVSSTVPPSSDNIPLGQTPTVRRVMQGAYNQRPPQPRYSYTWSVAKVLDHIRSLGPNMSLSLPQLTSKLCMLLALAKAARVSETCQLNTGTMRFLPDCVKFDLTQLTKTQRHGGPKQFFVPSFADDPLLCPVECIKAYLEVTRPNRVTPAQDALLLATCRPFQPVSTSTISRWVSTLLRDAGVDHCFSAHSTRGASSSAARSAGVSLADVLAAADWRQPNTFMRHYYRPCSQSEFGWAVLGSSLPLS